jgi:hypothetical protein
MSVRCPKINWTKWSLLLSLAVVSFAYGFIASHFRIFPYDTVRQAGTAALALVDAVKVQPSDGLENYAQTVLVPTAIQHARKLLQECVLVSGGADALKSHHPAGCLAWIIDRDGTVVHFWKNDPKLWADLHRATRVTGVSGAINPAGIHLCDNGDLLATFHGFNTFPFAIGMARFDANSNLLWRKEIFAHHNFSVAADGRIVVPALEVVDSPLQIGSTFAKIEADGGKVYQDVILVLDPDGNTLQRVSILEALSNSGWQGSLVRANSPTLNSDDPTHLNEAHLIGEEDARQLAGIAADDVLISLRNINTVAILDLKSERFKWLSAGCTMGQHSPRVFNKGILVFDNLGGDTSLGGTQLVHIDFSSGRPATLFPRPGVPMPDRCRTVNSGHLDVHRDGQHALMAITHEGAAWEVDLRTGEVSWEYIYVPTDSRGERGKLGVAKYVYDLSFLVGR